MDCYTHNENTAVAVCRSCGRGVCNQCAIEQDFGVVCSDACKEYGAKLNLMNERVLNIYGLGGKKPRRLSSILLTYGGLGSAFSTYGLVEAYQTGHFDNGSTFVVVMGLVFVTIGVISHFRAKKMGLHC